MAEPLSDCPFTPSRPCFAPCVLEKNATCVRRYVGKSGNRYHSDVAVFGVRRKTTARFEKQQQFSSEKLGGKVADVE